MFIDKNSIQINNISMGEYISEVEYQYPKLWGADSGRNLAGTQTGTFLGTYPKFTLTFRKLSKTELEYLAPVLDSAYQTFRYYDPIKQAYNSISTYASDYSFVNKNIVGQKSHKNEGFTISFVAVSRRV